jgi:diacylglycerol kinase family enzyme
VPANRVAVLLNAAAGTAARLENEKLGAELVAAFAQLNILATVTFLPGAELREGADAALRQAKDDGLQAIVAGGGDGTIGTVASVLAGSNVPLGILPLGTLNHFAKDLAIPLDMSQAVAVIAAGNTWSVDLGDVNGRTFINNSSVGIYPLLVLDRERRRALHGLPKWLAMIPATFRALKHFPRRRLRIKAAGSTVPYRSPLLFVGNNEYQLTPRALGKRERLDAGELCFYVARTQSRFGLIWLSLRAIFGRTDQLHDLRIFKVTEGDVTTRASRLPVACDGEVEVMRTPLHYRSRPGALRVFAPPPPFA